MSKFEITDLDKKFRERLHHFNNMIVEEFGVYVMSNIEMEFFITKNINGKKVSANKRYDKELFDKIDNFMKFERPVLIDPKWEHEKEHKNFEFRSGGDFENFDINEGILKSYNAVDTCDAIEYLKQKMAGFAKELGYEFSAKTISPVESTVTIGLHVNTSPWKNIDNEFRNLFFYPAGQPEKSEQNSIIVDYCKNWTLRAQKELFPIIIDNKSDIDRFGIGFWGAKQIGYSDSSKVVSSLVFRDSVFKNGVGVEAPEDLFRFENRLAGADASFYGASLVSIAGMYLGLKGFYKQLENTSSINAEIPKDEKNWVNSVKQMRESNLAKFVLGEELHEELCSKKQSLRLF